MNELQKDSLVSIYKNHTGLATGKFEHYLEIYDRYFSAFRGREITFVEVGVGGGGSLEVWHKYFGSAARIYGVDATDRSYLKFDPVAPIKTVIGDQSNRGFWKDFLPALGPIDIFIDDGGHVPADQMVTFEEVFPHVADGGIYICEDLQTSYIESAPFNGGFRKEGSFIEYCKKIIDDMNAWASQGQDPFNVTYLTHNIQAVSFYTFLVVIEKRKMDAVLHSPIMRGGQHVQQG